MKGRGRQGGVLPQTFFIYTWSTSLPTYQLNPRSQVHSCHDSTTKSNRRRLSMWWYQIQDRLCRWSWLEDSCKYLCTPYATTFISHISQPHTCQCTQCRKNCGTLVYHFHTATSEELTWVSKSTYAEYQATPGCIRAFCNKCGSNLGWWGEKVDPELEIAVGTIDEEYLLGGRDADDKATGAFGLVLANPEGHHFHQRNHVDGISEENKLRGVQFWRETKQGPMSGEKKQ